jgi:excisionase family DNA binding protein
MTGRLDEHYLTIAQAAERLHVNKSTIRRWIDQGTLPAYKIGQRRVALRAADLASLITPVRRTHEKAGGMKEIEHGVSSRLTPEQQRQGLAALEAARNLQAELLAERGGELFPSSWELINELRDERGRHLG